MSRYYGDFLISKTVRCRFNTVNSSGVPTTLTSGAVTVSKDGSDVTPSGGVNLTTDQGTVTGRHVVVIDMSVDPTTFTAGSEYSVRLSGSSAVGGTSVVGTIVGEWSTQNRTAQIDHSQALPSAPAANSVGESLFFADLLGGRVNTAQAGTSTTITLDAGASATANAYIGDTLYLYGGTGGGIRGSGQRRTIIGYNSTTKVVTVDQPWTTTPDNTTKFIMFPQPLANVGLVLGSLAPVSNGTAQAGASTTITLASGASATDNIYKGQRIRIVAGTGADQARIGTAYVGSTKVLTVHRAWDITPDNTSQYSISGLNEVRSDLAMPLNAPRDVTAVADGSMTLNDALWGAVLATAARRDLVSNTVTFATPATHTTYRTASVDVPSAPTFVH